MRVLFCLVCLTGIIGPGCASRREAPHSFSEITPVTRPTVALPDDRVLISAENRLRGKVAKANEEGGFVIMTFPIGHLPRLDERLTVLRLGVKVGEIRVTGPQLDDNVVGDIASGEAKAGDEVVAQ